MLTRLSRNRKTRDAEDGEWIGDWNRYRLQLAPRTHARQPARIHPRRKDQECVRQSGGR
jgi:hypothetical protein